MRDLAVLTFVTLDGVMQAPSHPDEDRSGEFAHGGWAQPYWQPVMEQVQEEAMSRPYDLLLGRKTYEQFASHWPQVSDDDPTARMLNRATKYVVTSQATTFAWNHSIAVSGDVAAEVSALKEQDGPLLQVHGSWQLIQALLAGDLIDEYRLWVFPVVLGSGKRLFAQGAMAKSLELVRSKDSRGGAVMHIYRRRSST